MRENGHRKRLAAWNVDLEVVRRDGLDAHRALDGVGKVVLALFKERLAVFRDEHAALKHRLDGEVSEIVDENEVSVVRGRDRPFARHVIALGNVEGRHRDGLRCGNAARNEAAKRVVHVSSRGEVGSVLVVRAG